MLLHQVLGNRRRTVIGLAALMLLAGSAAGQLTHTASKEVKFTWKPKPNQALPAGGAIFGSNFAHDKNLGGSGMTLPQTSVTFMPAVNGASYSDTKKAMHGVALGETKIQVGSLMVQADGSLMLSGSIDVKTVVPPPGPPSKGGKATARGKINIPGGKMTIESLKVDDINVKLTKSGKIPGKISSPLKKRGLYLDPISISLHDLNDGSILWESDLFNMLAESTLTSEVWLDDSDRLSLAWDPDEPTGMARFEMVTPDWVTDFNASASIIDGEFLATGLFMPDSGVISDFWDLVFDGTDVIEAKLRSDVLTDSYNASLLDIDFTLPLGASFSDDMLVDVVFSTSAYSELETVPGPGAGAVAVLGLLMGSRRRRG